MRSLEDVLRATAKERNIGEQELMGLLRQRGIRKQELKPLSEVGKLPTSGILHAVLDFLDCDEVALNLKMGLIPYGYEELIAANATRISEVVRRAEFSQPAIEERDPVVPVFETPWGKLHRGDCLDVLRTVDADTVDLIFADPPFNLNKTYDMGVVDNLSDSEYLDWTYQWIYECIRVLKPGGSLYIYNIPKWQKILATFLDRWLNFRSWITVDMKFGLPLKHRLYPAHYALLYYIKGDKPNVFNQQRIPLATCRHCGGELRDYGGYKNKMNVDGVNISDVWSDIYPVRHTSTKNREFNELSIKLLDRVVSISTNEGDTVLDPFGGSGTTYVVSELLKRRWIGVEKGNTDVIVERLSNLEKDKNRLDEVCACKNRLFTDKTRALRNRNGFWLPETLPNTETGN